MFKMGCSMAKKILAIDGKSSSPGGGGSSSGAAGSSGGGGGERAKLDKDAAGKKQQQGDELNDFSKLEDDPRLPLNKRQIFKITKSWKAIARTMSKTGTAMFLNLFEQNQDLFYLFDRFQHLKGKELHESMELREHAATVMATLDQSINSLSDYDNFVTYLHSIGKFHRKVPGFKRAYFWKIEQPFLKAVKQTLDERCNETIEEIYKIAIKLIIETISDGYGDDKDDEPPAASRKPPPPGGPDNGNDSGGGPGGAHNSSTGASLSSGEAGDKGGSNKDNNGAKGRSGAAGAAATNAGQQRPLEAAASACDRACEIRLVGGGGERIGAPGKYGGETELGPTLFALRELVARLMAAKRKGQQQQRDGCCGLAAPASKVGAERERAAEEAKVDELLGRLGAEIGGQLGGRASRRRRNKRRLINWPGGQFDWWRLEAQAAAATAASGDGGDRQYRAGMGNELAGWRGHNQNRNQNQSNGQSRKPGWRDVEPIAISSGGAQPSQPGERRCPLRGQLGSNVAGQTQSGSGRHSTPAQTAPNGQEQQSIGAPNGLRGAANLAKVSRQEEEEEELKEGGALNNKETSREPINRDPFHSSDNKKKEETTTTTPSTTTGTQQMSTTHRAQQCLRPGDDLVVSASEPEPSSRAPTPLEASAASAVAKEKVEDESKQEGGQSTTCPVVGLAGPQQEMSYRGGRPPNGRAPAKSPRDDDADGSPEPGIMAPPPSLAGLSMVSWSQIKQSSAAAAATVRTSRNSRRWPGGKRLSGCGNQRRRPHHSRRRRHSQSAKHPPASTVERLKATRHDETELGSPPPPTATEPLEPANKSISAPDKPPHLTTDPGSAIELIKMLMLAMVIHERERELPRPPPPAPEVA